MPGEKPKKKPSIEDVAKAAGVNYLYTQRVLAGNTEIPQATQEKVFNAVKELGYVKTHHPNHNLDRARAQLKLVRDMELAYDEMLAAIERYRKS